MATNERTVVMGVFRDRGLADQAIAALHNAGWTDEQISLVGRNTGGAFSGFKRMFSGQETAADKPADAMADLDLPDDQRQLYERELEAGYYLVLVHAGARQLEARDILHSYGAYNTFIPLSVGGSRTIPVREEVVQVGKQLVEVGEIRIHKRVITENKTFTVPVTREEVTIERVPRNTVVSPPQPVPANLVNSQDALIERHPVIDQSPAAPYLPTGAAPAAAPYPAAAGVQANAAYPPAATMPVTNAAPVENPAAYAAAAGAVDLEEVLRGGGALRIVVHEEQVLINKQPVIVEEIFIRKQPVEEMRQIIEPVRHEEVRLERIGNIPVRGDNLENVQP